MTRAHFVEALVATANHRHLGDSADEGLKRLLQGPMTAYWESISSQYLLYSRTDEALKQSVSYCVVLRDVFTVC